MQRLPIKPGGKTLQASKLHGVAVIALYDEGKGSGVYKIPNTAREFIWRYKLNEPAKRTSYVQAVDFSTMLYGLAALLEYLGPSFSSSTTILISTRQLRLTIYS